MKNEENWSRYGLEKRGIRPSLLHWEKRILDKGLRGAILGLSC